MQSRAAPWPQPGSFDTKSRVGSSHGSSPGFSTSQKTIPAACSMERQANPCTPFIGICLQRRSAIVADIVVTQIEHSHGKVAPAATSRPCRCKPGPYTAIKLRILIPTAFEDLIQIKHVIQLCGNRVVLHCLALRAC
jgi:hypothetical protein